MDILEEIVARKRQEVAAAREAVAMQELVRRVERQAPRPMRSMRLSVSEAAKRLGAGIIAEFKRRSPSKGWIHPDIEPEQVVPLYAANGAAALSVLTDEPYFGGRQEFVERVRPLVPSTPILRKDFIVDEYQLLEARLIGADAVLLIAAALTPARCRALLTAAHDLGLEVLLEIHDAAELDYMADDVDLLGVNNRHLGTFHTDVRQSFDIARQLPSGVVLVSESGIAEPQTVCDLRAAGFSGFLIGETFMREADPGAALRSFIDGVGRCLPDRRKA